MSNYLVVYHVGYCGPNRRRSLARWIKRGYATISQACKARDRLFARRSTGRWKITEAYVCYAIRGKRDRLEPFCRLNLAVRSR